jgi:DNA-binding Lrp family transcriptional regulator
MQAAEKVTQNQILPIVLGFWQARALAIATELDVAERLNDGPLHVNDLARQVGVNASALFRLLRALESIGIFSQISPYVFSNTSTSASLRKSANDSQWATVMHCLSDGCGVFEAWNEFGYVIKTGNPSVDKLYGFDFWELLRRNPRANEAMNLAMRSASHDMTPAVTAAYEWSRFPAIADIGGGIGTQLFSILDRAPKSRGILFDQVHSSGSLVTHDRVEVIGGSFFESVPSGADVYLLRFVLHDWADNEASLILKSVRRSIEPGAQLIVVESIIPDGPAFNLGKWVDLQMLVCVRGRERTQAEYRKLLADACFELQRVIPTDSPVSLLVAMPT